jgi:hypothetical protein
LLPPLPLPLVPFAPLRSSSAISCSLNDAASVVPDGGDDEDDEDEDGGGGGDDDDDDDDNCLNRRCGATRAKNGRTRPTLNIIVTESISVQSP